MCRKDQQPLLTINARTSLVPLLNFWEAHMTVHCPHMAALYQQVHRQLEAIPGLLEPLEDPGLLRQHREAISPLMGAVFSPASFNVKIAGALAPSSFDPFYVSPEFERLFIRENSFVQGRPGRNDHGIVPVNLQLGTYFLVLQQIYNIDTLPGFTILRIMPDQETGLDRHYRIDFDSQFIQVVPLEPPPELSPDEMEIIQDRVMDITVLSQYIDMTKFLFQGFTVARALDVTRSETLSLLEKQLVFQGSIFSSTGITAIEERLQVLFNKPDLRMGIIALQNDQVFIIKSDCKEAENCLFANSDHISLDEVTGSVWTAALDHGGVLRVADLSQKDSPVPAEIRAVGAGIRSMLLAPLLFQGKAIGVLEVFTHVPHAFGAVDDQLLEQVVPLFAVALKRGMDEMEKMVQTIIKEKCTAVHPSVEWRFERAAINHMERMRRGEPSEMEPIVFKDVIPFYGQTDIKNSSNARNRAIEQDLTRQLALALDVMTLAARQRPWPLLREYLYYIEKRMEQIAQGLQSGDETGLFAFLTQRVEPVFDELMALAPDVQKAIQAYQRAVDPKTGFVYARRRDYEESVAAINEVLSRYVDAADQKMQDTFPHYFERHQTDGVDYMMYIGASMVQGGHLAPFHIKNMTLWQLLMAWGLAGEMERVQPDLAVPLEAGHLILVNHSPLSIRFRFDEKRFDVDGAYDVRQEIIKSRIDKALIKGTGERLTQPGKIAVVYASPLEGREIRQHMDYLVNQGLFHDDLEFLVLDDLPDVRGLKALRVPVNLEDGHDVMDIKAGR